MQHERWDVGLSVGKIVDWWFPRPETSQQLLNGLAIDFSYRHSRPPENDPTILADGQNALAVHQA